MNRLVCLAAASFSCTEAEPPPRPPRIDRIGSTAVADPLGRGAWFVDEEDDAVLLATL
jgi:hypothetical protein